MNNKDLKNCVGNYATYTKHEYTNVSNALENLCQGNDIENWW